MVVQPGRIERATERGQRVEQAGDLVDQRRVVILPAGLVLLRAVMVVDGVQHAAGLLRRRAEQQGGLAAVGADLDPDAAVKVPQRRVVQRASLVGRHEALHLFG